jgi:hypothetical protein
MRRSGGLNPTMKDAAVPSSASTVQGCDKAGARRDDMDSAPRPVQELDQAAGFADVHR